MGWKNYPTLLKGGLIGLIIGLAISALYFLARHIPMFLYLGEGIDIYFYTLPWIAGTILGIVFGKVLSTQKSALSKGYKIGFWIGLLVSIFYSSLEGFEHILVMLVTYLIFFVLAGATIGWIIGKIKSR